MSFNVGKGGKTCSVCETEFKPEAEFFSALFEIETQLSRQDYCPGCWSGGQEGAFSHWRSRVRPPEQKKPTFEVDRVLAVFDQVTQGESDSRDRLRYLLALMLVRKRVFKFVGSARAKEAGIRVFCPERDKEYEIADPVLTVEEIEGARTELGALLEVDL